MFNERGKLLICTAAEFLFSPVTYFLLITVNPRTYKQIHTSTIVQGRMEPHQSFRQSFQRNIFSLTRKPVANSSR